jgi:hypothetical protein
MQIQRGYLWLGAAALTTLAVAGAGACSASEEVPFDDGGDGGNAATSTTTTGGMGGNTGTGGSGGSGH